MPVQFFQTPSDDIIVRVAAGLIKLKYCVQCVASICLLIDF